MHNKNENLMTMVQLYLLLLYILHCFFYHAYCYSLFCYSLYANVKEKIDMSDLQIKVHQIYKIHSIFICWARKLAMKHIFRSDEFTLTVVPYAFGLFSFDFCTSNNLFPIAILFLLFRCKRIIQWSGLTSRLLNS